MRQSLLLVSALLFIGFAGCLDGSTGDPDDRDDGSDPNGSDDLTVVWGALESATIRPGAPLADYCTYNFLFTDTYDNVYIGTAAHCTKMSERVVLGPDGPKIGTVVYDSDETANADTSVDFALIQLDADQHQNAHPQMFGWDGPTGDIEAGEAEQGDGLAIYGYGLVLREQEETRPRSGVLMDEDGETYRANLPAVNGDSGSPIIHEPSGKAFGIISHYGLGVPPSTDEGPIMPFLYSELEQAGFQLTLATP